MIGGFSRRTQILRVKNPRHLSPRANYTDQATAAYQRSLVLTLAYRGCHVISLTNSYGRILGFLHRSRYFFFQVVHQFYSRGWMDPVPDPLLFIKYTFPTLFLNICVLVPIAPSGNRFQSVTVLFTKESFPTSVLIFLNLIFQQWSTILWYYGACNLSPIPFHAFTPGTSWIGGWVGPRSNLDDMETCKFLILPGPELRPLRHQPVGIRYTDCDIAALTSMADNYCKVKTI
jgi:hypothetical protein